MAITMVATFSHSLSHVASVFAQKLSEFSRSGSNLLGSLRNSNKGDYFRQSSSNRIQTELDERRLKEKAERETAQEEERYFSERYKIGKSIGKGHYSTVRKAVDQATGRIVAIKVINKSGFTAKDYEGLMQEIEILETLNHPNIIKLYNHYQTHDKYCIVMEFCAGGELFDRIVERDHYSEYDAKQTVRYIAEALKYCHNLGVVHRDLKPENILLRSSQDDTTIKIADFGFAKFEGDGLSTALGTPGYIAPEILKHVARYTSAVDMWSLGVIIYVLLAGYPPFHAKTKNALYEKIKLADYEFHEQYWDDISFLAKDLISRLLVVRPEKRFTIHHVLSHPWLVDDKPVRDNSLKGIDLTPAAERLKDYQLRRKLKAGQKVALAVVKLVNTLEKQGSLRGLLAQKHPSESELTRGSSQRTLHRKSSSNRSVRHIENRGEMAMKRGVSSNLLQEHIRGAQIMKKVKEQEEGKLDIF